MSNHENTARPGRPGDSGQIDDSEQLGHVAIIGMAGRFPGARDLDEFWRNLREGVESVSFYAEEDLRAAGLDPSVLSDPAFVRAGAPLPGLELFDASFFNLTPREAELADPQHRLFLECAWEVLENAGYDAEGDKRIGVYAGAGTSDYFLNIYSDPELAAAVGDFQIEIGNDKDHLSTLASYKLNLRGPSVNVQTGCSTSLVAVHLACQAVLDYECDMALAGGVSARMPRLPGYFYREGGVLSPDGHCRAFDAKALGTVTGNGLGLVLLKRLEDALEDGDEIHAVIKGSAINNDGSLKVGYTAPSVEGQAEVIAKALAVAGISPETVSYVEAHGTGTPLGDPVEIAALTKCFRGATARKNFCAVGSVKTNVGHLNVAAGVAGLIKTVLALKHRALPPSLHFERPNPKINFAESPFFVNDRLAVWETGDGGPRRAGVSSFSIGGTNAHVIVEEAPPRSASGASRPLQLLTLSAKTEAALESATVNLSNHLRRRRDLDLADVAYTLCVGRKGFKHRRALVCRDVDEALAALSGHEGRDAAALGETGGPVVFMFPGQGAQHARMGEELYRTEEVFRRELDACAEYLRGPLGFDLREALFADGEASAERLSQTAFAQPALFAVEYALARVWMAWGVKPSAMIGHSLGEYVAACLAGVFSPEEALGLVAARGRLMQEAGAGAMLAVALPEEEVAPMLGRGLWLASVNAPASCVVSGTEEAVGELERHLGGRSVAARRLRTSRAFHSGMMESARDAFVTEAARLRLRAPSIPFISNVSGTWVTPAQATDPLYWGAHLRDTVRFSEGVAELLKTPGRILLEVGPGTTLTSLAKQHPAPDERPPVLSSLPAPGGGESEVRGVFETLGRLWLAGAEIDWRDFYAGQRRRRVPLPTYPFEREKFWIENKWAGGGPVSTETSSGRRPDLADWFYVPLWRQALPSLLPGQSAPGGRSGRDGSCALVFEDPCRLGALLSERFKEEGRNAVSVRPGPRFSSDGGRAYTIDPARREDYERLFEELRAAGRMPREIVHLWGVTPPSEDASELESYEDFLKLGFGSLLLLAQALAGRQPRVALSIAVVSNGVHNVTGEEVVSPTKAAALGPCRVIPKEFPGISCRSLDITLPASGGDPRGTLDQLVAWLADETSGTVEALRGGRRWAQTFEPVRLGPAGGGRILKEGGVYLVTGGGGGLGYAVAEQLARTLKPRLLLVESAPTPPPGEWDAWLETHGAEGEVGRRILKWRALEAAGAEVLVRAADLSDPSEAREVVEFARASFGEIDGVFHAQAVGGGLIQAKAGGAEALTPKAKGSLALEAALAEHPTGFVVLFSPVASVMAGFGQVDECGASAFLDAFAQGGRSRGGTRTVAVNLWDVSPGEATEPLPGLPGAPKPRREADGAAALEVVEAVERILSTQAPQVFVSPRDFKAAAEHMTTLTTDDYLAELERRRSSEPAHARPALDNSYVAPRNAIEKILAGIWHELFGIEQVGVNDDFIELGGHSLLALQLITRVRDSFQIELPLLALFESPTIARLAERIAEQQFSAEELEEIERLYEEIESISTEEARAQMAEELRLVNRREANE